jgi:hypothetical protein
MHTLMASAPWSSIGLRAGVVAGALVVWFWTQALIGRKAAATGGIGDLIHQLTAPLHQFFVTHKRAADAALIASSLFIDIIGLGLVGAAIFGPTFAPFLSVLIVFAMRQICQGLCTLPPPPGVIWRDPGFPALLVTYGVGNDLFFSGHTALAVLGGIQAYYLGPAWLGVAAGIVAFGEIVIVLVLRAHYTLDVIAGVLAAFCAAGMARWLAPTVDACLR